MVQVFGNPGKNSQWKATAFRMQQSGVIQSKCEGLRERGRLLTVSPRV